MTPKSAVSAAGLPELVRSLNSRVDAPTLDAITAGVKAVLEDVLGRGGLQLPARFHATRSDTYARRLLHTDPAGRYTAVVMTWAPGQATAVHDHGGLWCVEGVVDGEMQVTQFDVADHGDGAYRVSPVGRPLRAGVGTAGRLIPPTDYHVLGNALSDRPSVTLHIYGGSLDGCRVFVPRTDGTYEAQFRALTYDA